MIAVRLFLLSALCSNDDCDWPVHTSDLQGLPLRPTDMPDKFPGTKHGREREMGWLIGVMGTLRQKAMVYWHVMMMMMMTGFSKSIFQED